MVEYPPGLTPEQKKALDDQKFGGNGVSEEKMKLMGITEQAEVIEDEVSGEVEISGVGEEEPAPAPVARRGRKKKK